MRALVVRLRVFIVRAGFAVGRALPLRRHVLLATAHADAVGGNLAFIRDEIARRHPEVAVRVLAYRTTAGLRGRASGAVHAFRAGYALARASVTVVDDYYFPLYAAPRRPRTLVVQTWHASGAFKRIGLALGGRSFGAEESLTRRVRIHSNYDVCLVGSRRAAAHYAEAFGLPVERFRSDLGIPRTDLFFDDRRRREAADAVRARYLARERRRVVLFAPTFRGDRVTDARAADNLDLTALAGAVASDHVLLLRLHPFVRASLRVPEAAASFVVDVSGHADINELMLVSDVLVTDYSSAIFEFSLLERPMAFFAPDLDAYERERGFFFDYRTGVPGPVFDTTEALGGWLRAGQFDVETVRRFRDASFDVADGRASRRFVEELVLPTLGAA